jgi:hypothetical protein
MTARPILFSAPMVRAWFDGRKTQTRRIMKPQMTMYGNAYQWKNCLAAGDGAGPNTVSPFCPYGSPGDLLWVRETWQLHSKATDLGKVVYRASESASHTEFHEMVPVALIGDLKPRPFQEGWRSSIHVPRWTSRLTLELTDVRVERLQDISEEDAKAEGTERLQCPDFRTAFSCVWYEIHGHAKGKSWNADPWVWALSFRVHRCNIDNPTLRRFREAAPPPDSINNRTK